jgi:hypothetical protein
MGSMGWVRGPKDGQVQGVWRLGRFACQRSAHREGVLAIVEDWVGPCSRLGLETPACLPRQGGTDAFPLIYLLDQKAKDAYPLRLNPAIWVLMR